LFCFSGRLQAWECTCRSTRRSDHELPSGHWPANPGPAWATAPGHNTAPFFIIRRMALYTCLLQRHARPVNASFLRKREESRSIPTGHRTVPRAGGAASRGMWQRRDGATGVFCQGAHRESSTGHGRDGDADADADADAGRTMSLRTWKSENARSARLARRSRALSDWSKLLGGSFISLVDRR